MHARVTVSKFSHNMTSVASSPAPVPAFHPAVPVWPKVNITEVQGIGALFVD